METFISGASPSIFKLRAGYTFCMVHIREIEHLQNLKTKSHWMALSFLHPRNRDNDTCWILLIPHTILLLK